MDLGECPQIHDLALRADYEAAQKKKDHFYDIDVSIVYFKVTIIISLLTLLTLKVNGPMSSLNSSSSVIFCYKSSKNCKHFGHYCSND